MVSLNFFTLPHGNPTHLGCLMFLFYIYWCHYTLFNFWCLPLLPARQFGYVWMKSGSSETEVLHFFFEVIINLCVLPIWTFCPFWFLKLYSQWLHFKFCSDIVGTKCKNVAVAMLVDVDDSTIAEFDGHAAVTESVGEQTWVGDQGAGSLWAGGLGGKGLGVGGLGAGGQGAWGQVLDVQELEV